MVSKLVLLTACSVSCVSAAYNIFIDSTFNEYVGATMELLVPPQLPRINNATTLFIWPGLQPVGRNFLPIDNGVLQPVLTYGPSCAPNQNGINPYQWWISGQYVNTFGSHPGYMGCLGGKVMTVKNNDVLNLTFTKKGNIWTQTILNARNKKAVDYKIDMLDQAQGWFELLGAEITSNTDPSYVPEVVYKKVTISTRYSDPSLCRGIPLVAMNVLTQQANWKGQTLYELVTVDKITVSKRQNSCSLSQVTFTYSQTNPVGNLIKKAPFYNITKSLLVQDVCGLRRTSFQLQDGAVSMTLRNNLKKTVQAYWFDGIRRNLFGTIPVNRTWSVSTYYGQIWIIVEANVTERIFSVESSASNTVSLNISSLKGCNSS